MEKKSGLVNILIYLCITFFVITLIFIYISFSGKPQAGLIEVTCSASLFVIFLHLIKKLLPGSASIIASVLSILMAVSFVCINFHLQRKRNKYYTIKEFVIGDLFARKFFGDNDKSNRFPAKSFEGFEPIEFAKTTTEKFTIESSYEKPEEIILDNRPVHVPMDAPVNSNINIVKWQPFDSPVNNTIYELKLREKEIPSIDENGDEMVLIEDAITNGALPPHLQGTVFAPVGTERVQLNNVFGSKDHIFNLMPPVSSKHTPLEDSSQAIIGNHIKDKLKKP